MKDRQYQVQMVDDIHTEWGHGAQVVAGVLATGGGKSLIGARCLQRENSYACVMAHRKELVGQMSLGLARIGVRHNVIGPQQLVKYCVQNQMTELGTSFYHSSSTTTVVAVDTLLARWKQYSDWAKRVRLWVTDECHHLVVGNKWGRAVELFPSARGLGLTATFCRADGKGLGRIADGYVDSIVEGPGMRWLIDNGFLCDYRIVCPKSDLEMSDTDVGSTGDFVAAKLKAAAKRSHIVGDVVEVYLKYAKGQRTIIFSTDVETAMEQAVALQKAGIRAEAVSGDTPAEIRDACTRRFKNGDLQVLVNVDLFGEGYDVPAVECVIMARPTVSFGLFSQMFGRALRIMAGKTHALIIDMVSNIARHGLPDVERIWTLEGCEKTPRAKKPEDMIAQAICTGCSQPYPKFLLACPHCGAIPIPSGRSLPAQVDGDLVLLDPEVLKAMRMEAVKSLESPDQLRNRMRMAGAPDVVVASAYKGRAARLEHIGVMQANMAWWAEMQMQRGHSEREVDKMFYLMFGVDRFSAMTLESAEAQALSGRLVEAMGGPRCAS